MRVAGPARDHADGPSDEASSSTRREPLAGLLDKGDDLARVGAGRYGWLQIARGDVSLMESRSRGRRSRDHRREEADARRRGDAEFSLRSPVRRTSLTGDAQSAPPVRISCYRLVTMNDRL